MQVQPQQIVDPLLSFPDEVNIAEFNESTEEEQLQVVDKISQLNYIQSLIYSAPKISEIVIDEPYFEEGEFGLSADEAAAATIELRDSPEFQKRMQTLNQLDRKLDDSIQQFMLDTSIEFGVLQDLENTADPNDDNQTDIVQRAEKYASEFKERVNKCKHSNNI